MLICPECQHDNSEENKFCQKCGASLTHRNCQECGKKVPYGKRNCPNCNALSVDIYSCIINQPLQESLIIPKFEQNQGQTNLAKDESFLDAKLRYCLVKREETEAPLQPFLTLADRQFYMVSVMDLKPLQKSALDTNLEEIEKIDRQSLVSAGIPAIAFPYLTLAEFAPTIPDLYDAWINQDWQQEFVVISQQEVKQSLVEIFKDTENTLAQMMDYFDEMTKLWKSLGRVRCCHTLLEENNLGIGEDKSLVINRIYPDNSEKPPELKDLVQFWFDLLTKASRKETDLMVKLLDLINMGAIENVKQLASQMQNLAKELQAQYLLQQEEEKKEDLILIPPEEELNELSEQFDFDENDEEIQDDEDEQEEEDDEDESTVVSGELGNADEQPTLVLPMRLLSISSAGCTDIGRKRSHNEDCFAIESKIDKQETPQGTICNGRGLYIVCDGMGGHAAGEVASRMAVTNLHNYFAKHWQDELPDINVIKEGILQANQAIYDANMKKGNTGSQRMGTTLVMTLIQNNKVAIAHVGDSRIYRVTRKWGLEQLTTDHSVAQMDIRNGVSPDIAYARIDAFQLTQALGPRDNNFVHPDITVMDIKEDALFLLCSDGLCDNKLVEENWQSHLSHLISSKSNLEEGVSQLIDLANQFNGHDNITGILIRVKVQPNLDAQKSLFW